ncbi:hypothetical protein ACCO45_008440 [Purpureocillium lilacinum]|uniref:Uncharacterized protein n=1 Tax=Purpureocillium lilacinum TaxID=33203 RepID=A0ACC4DNC5_PURLI
MLCVIPSCTSGGEEGAPRDGGQDQWTWPCRWNLREARGDINMCPGGVQRRYFQRAAACACSASPTRGDCGANASPPPLTVDVDVPLSLRMPSRTTFTQLGRSQWQACACCIALQQLFARTLTAVVERATLAGGPMGPQQTRLPTQMPRGLAGSLPTRDDGLWLWQRRTPAALFPAGELASRLDWAGSQGCRELLRIVSLQRPAELKHRVSLRAAWLDAARPVSGVHSFSAKLDGRVNVSRVGIERLPPLNGGRGGAAPWRWTPLLESQCAVARKGSRHGDPAMVLPGPPRGDMRQAMGMRRAHEGAGRKWGAWRGVDGVDGTRSPAGGVPSWAAHGMSLGAAGTHCKVPHLSEVCRAAGGAVIDSDDSTAAAETSAGTVPSGERPQASSPEP